MDADICSMGVADFATEQPITTDHAEPSDLKSHIVKEYLWRDLLL